MIKISEPWKSWCRLCAAKEVDLQNDENNIVFITNHDEQMAEMLQRYFGIMLETEPERLCQRCLKRLQEFQSFAQHVEKVQAMYIEMDQLNWIDIRRKFDLIVFDEAPIHGGTANVQISECEETHLLVNVEEILNAEGTAESKETVNLEDTVDVEQVVNTDEAVNKEDTENDVSTRTSLLEECNPSVGENLLFCDDTEIVQSEYASSVSENDEEAIDVKSNTETTRKKKKTVAAPSKPRNRRPHACELCKRRYATFSRYRRHMRLEHKQHVPEDFQCNQCINTFTTAVKLECHLRTHLPLEMKKDFPCKICAKKFTTPYVLNKHVRAVHHNEKPYICEECGASLKSGSSLKTHMLTHTNERPYKCERCSKYFKQYPALRRHMESHAAEKLICTICGYELSTRGSLRRHMVVHSDVKHYKCEFCAQEFKRAEGYKNHLLLHTGLKPYVCKFCSRTFAHGSNCRSHLKKAHPEELEAFEQESKGAAFINNVPKMEQLKAISKTAINIYHVQSKTQKKSD